MKISNVSDKRHLSLWVGVGLILAGLSGFLLISRSPVHAASPGEHLVTIYDNGIETTVSTTASTVGEVLKRANITVDNRDAVEPGINTELASGLFNINIFRARPVTVIDGKIRRNIVSPYQSPKKIAESAELRIHPEDSLDLNRIDDFIGEDSVGLKLTIDRATPFNLTLYGKPVPSRSQARTVGEMLEEKNIKLGAKDGTSVPLSTRLKANMAVEVWRNGVRTKTEAEPIKFPVRQIQDTSREVGYREIKTPGVIGKKLVSYEIKLQNGKEVRRTEIQSVILEQPIEQVEVIGTKPSFTGSFSEALAKLRACESGGNYANKNNSIYRGAYQYSYSTWANYQGIYDPADAPPSVQDQKAWETYQSRGWQPWPHCGSGLPDTYR